MPTPGSRRSLVRVTVLALAGASLVWTLWLLLLGGFDTTLFGVRLRSNNPQRTLTVSLLLLAAYFLAGGTLPVRRAAARVRTGAIYLAGRPIWLAGLIAAGSLAASYAGNTRIAGGSDTYGYLSQADLWLRGDLTVEQAWMKEAPWPDAKWTFTPLGYRPATGQDDWFIVPTYSPGLPMLFAVAKRLGGQCGMFVVGPLMSALAVLATYGIGSRLSSRITGLTAAWFVATSPVILGSLEPLSDVPAMAAWTLALYFLLGQTASAALASGLFVALAILIRPNLFPLAAPMAAWFFLRTRPEGRNWWKRWVHASVFAAGVLAGVAAVALINHHLYGSAATSGYGRFSDQFAWTRVVPNLRRYLTWFVEIQTPVALLGLIALYVPARRIWPHVPDRRVFIVFGAYLAILWGIYAAYLEFDSWGYLRFLFPGWPLIMLGLGASFVAAAQAGGPSLRWLTGTAVVAFGVWMIWVAVFRIEVYEARQAARHEAPLGRLIRAYTPENSVVLAFERSGSMRYYGGRVTLRYDLLDGNWLDRAVAWLGARGVRVYAVLDQRQAAEVKQRFATQQKAAVFDHPFLTYEPAGTSLFDLSATLDPARPRIVIVNAFRDRPGCDPPVPMSPPRFQ